MKEHLWEEEPYAFVHPWTNRDVMIGHASLACEILEDCPDVETVFVPVGGGGLMGGVGSAIKALKPDTRVVAVEPTGCASLYGSLQAGEPVSVQSDTICDGVAVPYMTHEMFPVLREVTDDCVLVSDDEVKAVVRQMAFGNKLGIEPSAAVAPAAAQAMPGERRGRSVCLVTGGSIDPAKFISIIGEDNSEKTLAL